MRISAETEEAGRRTLAYSGDTGPTPSLLEIAADADLFLCEASFRHGDDNPPGLHLTGAECGDTAAKCKVKRLVMTHVPPWHDAAGDAHRVDVGLRRPDRAAARRLRLRRPAVLGGRRVLSSEFPVRRQRSCFAG